MIGTYAAVLAVCAASLAIGQAALALCGGREWSWLSPAVGLALLCAQNLPGRRFFRVVFFLPMMITPVGIAYTFRMMTDTSKGPFAPLWQAVGLGDFAWAATAWGARAAVMIGDAWQWIPFIFIILLLSG